MQGAANGGSEPDSAIVILCCERAQRGNFCNSVNDYATVRRKTQPFVKFGVKQSSPTIKLRPTQPSLRSPQ